MSQKDAILQHLQRAPLTPIEALNKFDCFRLAARIEELRHKGYAISTSVRVEGGKRFAEYELQ